MCVQTQRGRVEVDKPRPHLQQDGVRPLLLSRTVRELTEELDQDDPVSGCQPQQLQRGQDQGLHGLAQVRTFAQECRTTGFAFFIKKKLSLAPVHTCWR